MKNCTNYDHIDQKLRKYSFYQVKCTLMELILALPTYGQKCIFPELHPKNISNFDLGHPVFEKSTHSHEQGQFLRFELHTYNVHLFKAK